MENKIKQTQKKKKTRHGKVYKGIASALFLLKIVFWKLLKRRAPESVGAVHTPIVAGVHPYRSRDIPLSWNRYTPTVAGVHPYHSRVIPFS